MGGTASYSERRHDDLRDGFVKSDFSKLTDPNKSDFQEAYAGLGELLLIDRDRIVHTIVASHAKGFAHGWWIFG